MKKFFRFFINYLRTAPKVFLFELLYKLMTAALGLPLLSFLVNTAMNHVGISYLTLSNLKTFLLDPITLIILVLLVLLIAFSSAVEICALISGFSYSHERKKITVIGMFRCGFQSLLKIFRGLNPLSLLRFILIMPIIQLIMSYGLISSSFIHPIQVTFGIYSKILIIAAIILIELLFIWILSGRSYTLHYLTLTNHKFSKCSKKSRECLSGRRLRTALSLVAWSLVTIVFAAAATFLISFIIIFGIKGFSRPNAALLSSLKVLSYAGKIFLAVSAVFTTPFIIGGLTNKFFDDNIQEEEITLPNLKNRSIPKYLKIITSAVIIAGVIFLNFPYIQNIYRGNVSFNVGIFKRTQITAHRGFSYAAPENTIYAFEEAININADYIELDVQQTSDGQLVVFHDDSIKRTTGYPGLISDYTYDELLDFSVGSWFKKGDIDFSDAKIMLLSEVLELADENNILLNIEIKRTDNTIETARKTAEMLQEYEMTDLCYVTSFEYSALKEIKQTDKSIKTALISNVAIPAVFTNLKYIDAVSLNYFFVSQNIINQAHKNGKLVMVWTVNNKADIKHMISIGADNIITDRPDIAAEAVYSYGTDDFVISLLEMIFG